MSAIAPAPGLANGWRRPSLFRLLAAVLGGEILAAFELWPITIVLGLIGVTPIGGNDWIWLPWQIDGAWALIGAIGWGYLVCALVAQPVSRAIERRGYGRPAAGWLRISIAVSGYGAMAVGHTAGAHITVAVLGGALVVRLVAFNLDGSLRAWRWRVPPRLQLEGALAAAIVALSYGALHGFVAQGSGGTYNTGTIDARVGHTETVSVGLNHMRLPVEITGVALSGPGVSHIRASALVISPNGGVEMIPKSLRNYPGARHFSGFVWQPTRLPYRVSAGSYVWISMRVRLNSCGDVFLNTLKLRYTVLGISTGENIPLEQPLTLACHA